MKKRFLPILLLISLIIIISGCEKSCDNLCKEEGFPKGRCRTEPLSTIDHELGKESCEDPSTSCVCAPTCMDFCQITQSTPGECDAELGDPAGRRYCEDDSMCVCIPQPCEEDKDCLQYNIHFICASEGCMAPGCSLACKKSGYQTGVCGGDSGDDIGSAYCGQTFKQCMCT
tara:strand:- start:78 stop:593 length:516 start_codon:yes stop_codon:yes gene_type:complete